MSRRGVAPLGLALARWARAAAAQTADPSIELTDPGAAPGSTAVTVGGVAPC